MRRAEFVLNPVTPHPASRWTLLLPLLRRGDGGSEGCTDLSQVPQLVRGGRGGSPGLVDPKSLPFSGACVGGHSD